MNDTPPDMKVRMSADLRRKVEAAASANNRTMNGEIVARLEQSFARDGQAADGGLTWVRKAKQLASAATEKEASDRVEIRQRLAELEMRVAALEKGKKK